MLIQFAVENYKSFKEKTTFSMVASESDKHHHHVIRLGHDIRLLKGSLLFGANASGKSNLIDAMRFSKAIILETSSAFRVMNRYFRLEKEHRDKVGVFSYVLACGGRVYRYAISLSYLDGEILEETLNRLDTGVRIFERRLNAQKKISVESDLVIPNDKERFIFELYREEMNNNPEKTRHETFLKNVGDRMDSGSASLKDIKNVLDWFENTLEIMTLDAVFARGQSPDQGEDDDQMKTLADLLIHLDTGIQSIKSSEVAVEADELVKEDVRWLQELDHLEKRKRISYRNEMGEKITVFMENGLLKSKKLVFSHGNDASFFDYAEESTGTQRLIDMLPVFSGAFKNKVVIIDEIDSGLHTGASYALIDYFYRNVKGISPSQLIATTHNSSLMDTDLMRLDELWLVEKGKNQETTLSSLNNFDIPEDVVDLDKRYKIGRYGAIPKLKYTDALAKDKEA